MPVTIHVMRFRVALGNGGNTCVEIIAFFFFRNQDEATKITQ